MWSYIICVLIDDGFRSCRLNFVQAESNDISCGDVPRIAEVSDVENLSILPFEFHEVTGLGVFGICENGGHLAAFHPSLKLPHRPIIPIRRAEGSGDTFIYMDV